MITHVRAAIMYVADQERSLDFYVNKLGFVKRVDEELWPGARWIEIQPAKGETAIVISSAAAFGKRPGEGAYLTFSCDDVAATINELRSAGVQVSDPIEESWGTYIKATDPDGHEMHISQGAASGVS